MENEQREIPHSENIFLEQKNLDARDRSIQEAVSKIAEALTNIELAEDEKFSVPPEVVIVGGYVRDLLFRNFFKVGKKSKDADLEIYGVPIHRVKEVLERLFPGKVETTGAAFQVFKVFLGNGLDVDVAIPRVESKKGGGHKDYEVTGVPDLPKIEAARRRDFTINAIFLKPKTGEIYDYYGGQKDLENKILRVVDPVTFSEDALRVMRAVQFSARLGFSVDPESFKLMKELVASPEFQIIPVNEKAKKPAGSESLAEEGLSAGRFKDEWEKLLLKSEKVSFGLELMRELGIIDKIYPELSAVISGADGEAKWQKIKGQMDAVLAFLRKSERVFSDDEKEIILFGLLCQDMKVDDIKKFLDDKKRFTFNKKNVLDKAAILAKENHRLMEIFSEKQKAEVTERQFAGKLVELLESLGENNELYLATYEMTGDETQKQAVAEAQKVIEKFELSAKPLITGPDIFSLDLGIKPGEMVGRIMKTIKEKRRSGEILTRSEALAALPEIVALELKK